MTVQELIQKLSALDPNMQVLVPYNKSGLDIAQNVEVGLWGEQTQQFYIEEELDVNYIPNAVAIT